MHLTTSLAERYLAEGYDLERLPLPAPFDFLARAPDGQRRVAAFASRDRVTASALVDVRLVARDLGARAVFLAASFSDDARRMADRFGIELVDVPARDVGDSAPVPAPPQAVEDLPVHGAALTVHDFPDDPTPDELRAELAEVNTALAGHGHLTPEQATEASLAESAPEVPAPDAHVFLPRELPTHADGDLVRVAEAAIPLHPAEDDLTDLAAWYEGICALEQAEADRELVDWYETVLELERRTLDAEMTALALHGRVLDEPLAFAPTPAAAVAFREVEAEVPAVAPAVEAPPPFPELAWPEVEPLAPMARAGRVLAAEPQFGAPDKGAVAFRTVEDAVPDLPEVAFTVIAEEPVEDPVEEVLEAPDLASPFLPPQSVLPWTPASAPALPPAGFIETSPVVAPARDPEPLTPIAVDVPALPTASVLPWTPTVAAPVADGQADPALFLDAFQKAQTWNTAQRIESVREAAHAEVVAASDAPKPKTPTHVAHDADFELL